MTPHQTRTLAMIALVALLALPVVAAHGGEDDHDVMSQDVRATFTLQRYETAELNMESLEGAELTFSVETGDGTPVRVDVHTHNGNGTEYFFLEENATNVREGFTFPSDGTYSIAIAREVRDPVEVTLRVKGVFAVLSTSGFALTEESPDLPMLVALGGLAALVAAAAWARRR